ncbi:MAG TPA: transposase [Anaerolineae bacterium]
MTTPTIHQCQCELCQRTEPDPLKEEHRRMNLFLSRLDEQQRRWYAALEAERLGHGGLETMAQITGLNVNTISRGRKELNNELQERPSDRVRVEGGGRKASEKKSQN